MCLLRLHSASPNESEKRQHKTHLVLCDWCVSALWLVWFGSVTSLSLSLWLVCLCLCLCSSDEASKAQSASDVPFSKGLQESKQCIIFYYCEHTESVNALRAITLGYKSNNVQSLNPPSSQSGIHRTHHLPHLHPPHPDFCLWPHIPLTALMACHFSGISPPDGCWIKGRRDGRIKGYQRPHLPKAKRL